MSISELQTKLQEVQILQSNVMEDICSMIDKIDVEQLKRIKELDVEKLGRSQKLRYCALHVRLFKSGSQ